jgi:hypothetical protein
MEQEAFHISSEGLVSNLPVNNMTRFKDVVDKLLEDLSLSEWDGKGLQFESSLSPECRSIIHEIAGEKGLYHKSLVFCFFFPFSVAYALEGFAEHRNIRVGKKAQQCQVSQFLKSEESWVILHNSEIKRVKSIIFPVHITIVTMNVLDDIEKSEEFYSNERYGETMKFLGTANHQCDMNLLNFFRINWCRCGLPSRSYANILSIDSRKSLVCFTFFQPHYKYTKGSTKLLHINNQRKFSHSYGKSFAIKIFLFMFTFKNWF